MELNFGYVASYIIFRVWAKIYTKLLCIYFYMNYFVFMPYLSF
jgi:hypothetical protein